VLKLIVVSAIAALATVGATAPLAAQARSAVNSAELEAAVIKAPAANQEAVQRFLRDSRVNEVAAKLGIQTADLAAAVRTLDEGTLSQLADRTRAAERDLAGGDQIVISTTVIIIVLLILILLTN
jgi:Skp family chaperone for outer membrane proteins